jgi:hypothetical protein
VKNFLIVLSVLVLISAFASAQITSRGAASQPGTKGSALVGVPAPCSPCLWYSGDGDPLSLIADGLFNSNATWSNTSGQVYVPFIPAPDGNPTHLHVLISSVTFNLQVTTPDTNPPADFAGMTYEFRSKQVLSGNGGTLGKHGGCFTTSVVYTGQQYFGFYNEYSFTCYFKTPVKVAVGTVGWVSLLPKFTTSNIGYLSNATDVPGLNQYGWSDDFYNSFFNSTSFGVTFAPATNFGSFQQFSVAIAGTYIL